MASRPFLSSLLAVGMTATALHIAGTPPNPVRASNDLQATTQGTHTAVRTSPLETLPWSDQMDRDPAAAGKASAEKGFAATLCQRADAQADEVCAATILTGMKSTGEGQAGNATAAPARAALDAEVAFAIVPDPLHTHLALWFDRSIDSIEDAITDGHWNYDRNWMPWSTEPSSANTIRFRDREQERLFQSARESLPGLIFFRPSTNNQQQVTGRPDKPLVVLLIGDSPTGGINQEQFRQAVRQFSLIAPSQPTLSVIGPNFTGSGPSLRHLLAEAKESALKNVTVNLASGSISDPTCDHLLPGGMARSATSECVDAYAVHDSFVSFDADFLWGNGQTERYLEEKGDLKEYEIAELNEDESGFGNLARVETDVDRKADARRHKAKDAIEQKTTEDPRQQRRHILKLTFPRNISHLRSAYQKNGVWGFGGTGSGTGSISLNLDFEEQGGVGDSVPTFANRQLPVSQEATLGQVSATLEQHHIRAVLVSATDVLDELFVAQVLSLRNPNLAIIVRGTDVLFLRSGDGGVYHNMYAVSPWPLIPRNILWSGPPPADSTRRTSAARLFPSDHAQALYAAARYLTRGAELLPDLQEYRSPVAEPGTDPQKQHAPLWLLSIGHGTYWPFAVLTSRTGSHSATPLAEPEQIPSGFNLPGLPLGPAAGIQPGNEPLPITQKFLIFVACLLALMHAGKCLELSSIRHFAPRYRIVEEQVRVPKRSIQLAISLLGMILLRLLVDPGYVFGPDPLTHLAQLIGLGSLCAAAGAATVGLLNLQRHPPADPWQKRAVLPAVTALATLLFGLSGAITMPALWHILTPPNTPDGANLFFLYRSHYSLGGASPTFPLMTAIAGLLFFLYSQMDRFNFGPLLAPRLPSSVHLIPNLPSNQSVSELSGLMHYPPRRRRVVLMKASLLLIIGAAVLIVASLSELAPLTFDGAALRYTADASFFLLLLALLWDLAMARVLWSKLKELCLDPLESSPLRRGFTAVSGIRWKDLWLIPHTHSGLTQYRALLRALEQASRCGLDTVSRIWILRMRQDELWTLYRAKAHLRDQVLAFSKVQRAAANVCSEILGQLKYAWACEQTLITDSDDHERIVLSAGCSGKALAGPGAEQTPSGSAAHTSDPPALTPELRIVREEWVALIYIHYIRLVLMQIRSRLLTSAILYILLVWTVTSYPYLNRHVLTLGLSVVFAILAVLAVMTYASINRDPILNRTTENKVGQLDLDFYMKTASIVGIPLLGLIATQFPEISSFVFSWIEPSMAAVK